MKKTCIWCKQEFSSNGIGGDRCSRSCHTKWLNSKRDRSNYKYRSRQKPKKQCLQCGSNIPTPKSNKFCNSSCAASWNNKNPHRKRGPTPKIINHCKKCYNFFSKDGMKSLCQTCRQTTPQYGYKAPTSPHTLSKQNYRSRCRFKLNKRDHAILFDADLIKAHGWYSPTNKGNNLNGVSWDHLFPIWKGYEMGIPPNVMSHPANAELVQHHENIRRYAQKEVRISYEELVDRIDKWGNKPA